MGIINFVRWTTQNESERKEGMYFQKEKAFLRS